MAASTRKPAAPRRTTRTPRATAAKPAPAASTKPAKPTAELFYNQFGDPRMPGDYPLGPDENRELLLRKVSRSTSWVYIAINRIANAAAQIPLQIIRSSRKGKPNAIDTSPAGGLRALLDRPNVRQTYFDFVEGGLLSLEATGDWFILLDQLNGRNQPRELWSLDPSKMEIVPDAKNMVAGYKYKVNKNAKTYAPNEIIHIKYAHPFNTHRGLAPLSAARMAIGTDVSAAQWNQHFLDNGAWPAGAITTPNDVSKETRARLQRQIKKMVQGGKKSVAQILLLTGGMDYKPIAISPKDLDWLDARRMSRDEILAIFGVPFAVAGLSSNESTTARSAGVAQQVKNFYLFTVFPKMLKVAGALSQNLAVRYPGGKELVPDLMSVPALADDVQKRLILSQTFRTLMASGWPLNAILAELYPHVSPFAHGEAAWLNSAMIPILGPENPVQGVGDPQAGSNVPTDPTASEPTPKAIADRIRRLGINSGTEDALARIFIRHGATL